MGSSKWDVYNVYLERNDIDNDIVIGMLREPNTLGRYSNVGTKTKIFEAYLKGGYADIEVVQEFMQSAKGFSTVFVNGMPRELKWDAYVAYLKWADVENHLVEEMLKSTDPVSDYYLGADEVDAYIAYLDNPNVDADLVGNMLEKMRSLQSMRKLYFYAAYFQYQDANKAKIKELLQEVRQIGSSKMNPLGADQVISTAYAGYVNGPWADADTVKEILDDLQRPGIQVLGASDVYGAYAGSQWVEEEELDRIIASINLSKYRQNIGAMMGAVYAAYLGNLIADEARINSIIEELPNKIQELKQQSLALTGNYMLGGNDAIVLADLYEGYVGGPWGEQDTVDRLLEKIRSISRLGDSQKHRIYLAYIGSQWGSEDIKAKLEEEMQKSPHGKQMLKEFYPKSLNPRPKKAAH